MIVQRAPRYPGTTRRAPLRAFHVMGNDVVSDFALRDLPHGAVAKASTSLLATTRPFPPAGAVLREVHDTAGASVFRVTESEVGLQYWARDVGTFWIERCGTRIWYRVEPDVPVADVEHLLAGPVLGLAFQSQGQTLLHAGAVAIDGLAIGFMAPHGFGKSTLTASFARAGFPVITDDLLPLGEHGGRLIAYQGVPRMKLWRDSLAALGDDEQQYDIVLSGAEKRRVPVGGRWGAATTTALPLAALYLLEPHTDPTRPIAIAGLSRVQSVLSVLGNTYMADALRGQRAVRALAAASRVTSAVTVRSVSYYRDFATLPALRTALCADARERHDHDRA